MIFIKIKYKNDVFAQMCYDQKDLALLNGCLKFVA